MTWSLFLHFYLTLMMVGSQSLYNQALYMVVCLGLGSDMDLFHLDIFESARNIDVRFSGIWVFHSSLSRWCRKVCSSGIHGATGVVQLKIGRKGAE